MSKMSIMSVLVGLLFLGALFFLIGFLAAVATLKTEEETGHSLSAWQASNAPAGGSRSQSRGPFGRFVGGLMGQAVHEPLRKVAGAGVSVVPRPLQPFARYGATTVRGRVQAAAGQMDPFGYHGPIAQQPYGAQRFPEPQYGAPQAQAYGSPNNFPQAYGGYQQPPPIFPRGGQAYGRGQGYAFPPQQMMMPQQMLPQQQPYYQQPMAPQQPMMTPPQMMPPQQRPMTSPQMMPFSQRPMMSPQMLPPQMLPSQMPMMSPQQQMMMQQQQLQQQYQQQMARQQGYR